MKTRIFSAISIASAIFYSCSNDSEYTPSNHPVTPVKITVETPVLSQFHNMEDSCRVLVYDNKYIQPASNSKVAFNKQFETHARTLPSKPSVYTNAYTSSINGAPTVSTLQSYSARTGAQYTPNKEKDWTIQTIPTVALLLFDKEATVSIKNQAGSSRSEDFFEKNGKVGTYIIMEYRVITANPKWLPHLCDVEWQPTQATININGSSCEQIFEAGKIYDFSYNTTTPTISEF